MYEDKFGSGWLEFRLFDEHQRDRGWILLVCHDRTNPIGSDFEFKAPKRMLIVV